MERTYDFYSVKQIEKNLYSIIQNESDEIQINLPDVEIAQVAFLKLDLFPDFISSNYVNIDDINNEPNNFFADSKEMRHYLIDSLENNDKERFIAESIKFYKSAVFAIKRINMNKYFESKYH